MMPVTDLKNVLAFEFELLWSKAKNGYICPQFDYKMANLATLFNKREGTTGFFAS